MKCGIYARKSTDDSNGTPKNKSVKRQVDHARRYAKKHGWTVDAAHILTDDGISGAEYQNRPGFTRLLTQLKHFDVLVISESSRLGRDMLRNAYHVGEILESDVRIFYYLSDEEEKADTAEQRIMLTLKSYASEVERDKASQRSRDALTRKAEAGRVAGGIVYGYSNVWILNDGTRIPAAPGAVKPTETAYTEYEINPEQADVIRNIHRMYADGAGLMAIAKTLNGNSRYAAKSKKYFAGQTPPSPRKSTGSWAPSSVRGILHNERYEGKIPYGQFRKAYKKGTRVRIKQDKYLMIDAPQLRIVDDKLAAAVRKRQQQTAKTYVRSSNGTLWGRPGMGRDSKYLLTGMARCSSCGANLVILGGSTGHGAKRKPIHRYGCSYNHNRGATVCANDHKVDMLETDNRVIDAIESQIFVPGALEYSISKAVELILKRQAENPRRPQQIERELKKLRKELDRFMTLIAGGGAPATVLDQIKQREDQIKALETELLAVQAQPLTQLDHKRLQKATSAKADRFKELLHGDIPLARQALRKLLAEPMQFEPVVWEGNKTYSFSGVTKVGALLDSDYIGGVPPSGP